jgi:hypothetical protein
VFADGTVLYNTMGSSGASASKDKRSDLSFKLPLLKVEELKNLLDNGEIQKLPAKISPVLPPIDFFWQKEIQIFRGDKSQDVQIENFYPFANEFNLVYSPRLIELECTLQQIADIGVHGKETKDSQWCKEVIMHQQGLERRASTAKSDNSACVASPTSQKIVAGIGWGNVRLGSTVKEIQNVLGNGVEGDKFSDLYFKQYPPKGIEVSYENKSNRVHALFFYHEESLNEWQGDFCGETDKGVSWNSTVEDLRKVYGTPVKEYLDQKDSGAWGRIVYEGIDFRFENGKLVRIGIPGR